MEKSFKRRIRKIDKYLEFFLNENENFHLGIPFQEYLESPLLDKYKLPKIFPSRLTQIEPIPKGSVTKVNSKGKFVRKQPVEFEVVIKRIDYVRKKDRKRIIYDRRYNIFKKNLLHKFNSKLSFVINPHNEKLVVSEKLKFNKAELIKATHIANIFNEIFNSFEVYDENLNPAINFNTKFDQLILPSGKLDDQNNFDELIEIGKRFIKDESQQKAYQKRLQFLMLFNPDIRGKSKIGFKGYIVFGFSDMDIVILETMYSGNATYIFTKDNFENNIINDKQTVLKDKLFLKKFNHVDNWKASVSKFLEKLKKQKKIK